MLVEIDLLVSTRLREIEWRCRSEEARPVGVYSELVPAGSSSPNPKLAPRILQYFDF